jgi:hypothetical protein
MVPFRSWIELEGVGEGTVLQAGSFYASVEECMQRGSATKA